MNAISHRHCRPIFDALPTPTLLLDGDLVIRAVNKAYQRAVGRSAAELVGLSMFEAFPDNPEDPDADGVANLSASLETATRTRRPHNMVVQRYDVLDSRTGRWQRRVWQPQNAPVIDDNQVVALVHQVHDITSVEDQVRDVLTRYRDVLQELPRADHLTDDVAEHVDAVVAMLVSRHELADEVMHLRRALTSRATIEQAKGIIMADRRCTPEEAFQILVRLSSDTNVKLSDVALAFVYQTQAGGAAGRAPGQGASDPTD